MQWVRSVHSLTLRYECQRDPPAGFGHNTTALLIARGLAEMTRLAIRKGANPATMTGLAGVGDLLLTCTSTQSRNFTVGRKVALGEPWKGVGVAVAEGVETSESVHRLAAELGVEMPICDQV